RRSSANSTTCVSPPPHVVAELTCRMRITSYKIGEQFGAAYSRSAHLADDDAGSVIRQRRGFFHRRACRMRQCQRGDHRVARTGDVENLASECRQMLRAYRVLRAE